MRVLNYDIDVTRGVHPVTTNEVTRLDEYTIAINLELLDLYIIIEKVGTFMSIMLWSTSDNNGEQYEFIYM